MPDEITTSTTTTSTTTTTTLIPSKPLQELGNFIDSIYPKYVLRNNKLPFDIIKLGNTEVFSLVQMDALPTWLDIDTFGIKGIPTSNTTTSSYITVINYREPEFLNTKIYITYIENNLPVTVSFPITKNNQIFNLAVGLTYQSFYIAKNTVVKGVESTVVLYSYSSNTAVSDPSKGYEYAINNAYCDVYERTGLESRTFKATLPIFKVLETNRQNYKLVVDLSYRNLYSTSLQNLTSNPNYQLEIRFRSPEGVEMIQGSYENIIKLPTDNLIIGVDTLLPQEIKNLSSLETITEVLILLAKLKYADKKSGNNYIENYFQSLLNTLASLPRVSNLFYSKYSFNENSETISIFNDPENLSKIDIYPNLYMACRFIESKDSDLINFVQTSGLLNAIYQCIEINQNSVELGLNYSNLVRKGFEIKIINNVAVKSVFTPNFTLKDQILLYILYKQINANDKALVLLDKINLMFNNANNTANMYLSDNLGVSFYKSTSLDYVWADYFYSSLNSSSQYAVTSSQIALWIKSILDSLNATVTSLNKNLNITSADYNADYDIDFSTSMYPKSALTYSSDTTFAYTPYTIMHHYLKRTAVQGNFLNNYETPYGVIGANRGLTSENIFVTPNLFSTVLQILSKISPADYFAIKTEFLTSTIPATEMLVNYYPVSNGVLVTVNLQYALGIVAITFSQDGSTVYDKRVITTQSNTHSFVINAPKTSGFILSVNPIIKTV